MDHIRIIPCLDVKDGRIVKGIHSVDLRDAGDPVEQARVYSDQGADEITFLDITATVEGRKTTLDLVRRTAQAISVPLIVGGGIGSLEDMERLLEAGASCVSVNTAAVQRPELIAEAAQRFGSRRLIVAIDGRRNEQLPSGYEVMTHGGRKATCLDAAEWARRAAQLGAGQLLPTSMEADGTKEGYDLPFTRAAAEASGLPVIASGGAGTLAHLYQAVMEGKAQALLAASVFHFGEIAIPQAKHYLRDRGLPVRLQE